MRTESMLKRGMPAVGYGVAAAFGFAWLAGTAPGQPTAGVEALDFKIELENYAPPYEAQPKTLLESARVQPQPDRTILLTEAKLKTFSTNGTIELLAQSPQCSFDTSRRIASSAGPLQLQTGDRRFFTEGLGFCWDQTNSSLLISSRVHTITRRDLLPSPGNRPPGPAPETAETIEVRSDWFHYDRNSGFASYHGQVRVTGTDLQLATDHLSLELPVPGTSFKSILADGQVMIDHGELHATGDQAAYFTSNEVVTLTGHPAWRMGRREGRGDELVLDRTNNLFRVRGNAWLKFPRDASQTSVLLDQNPASINTPDSSNRFVEIFSDNYELSTNLAVFRRQVRGAEFVEDRLQGKLDCGLMTIWFSGSTQVQRIVARDHVVVEQNGNRLVAEEAVFSATNPVAEFSGKPSWQSGLRDGSGDLLLLDRVSHELRARGNARMKLPADQFRIVEMSPAAASASAEPAGNDKRLVEISCDEYDLKQDCSTFLGKVRLRNPRGRLACDLLTVALAQNPGEETRNAVAERKQNRVEMVWMDREGQTNYSWSDKAVYTYTATNSVTNEIVTVSGKPVVTNARGTYTGDPIVWDRLRNTVYAAQGKSASWPDPTHPPELSREPEPPGLSPPGQTNRGTVQ